MILAKLLMTRKKKLGVMPMHLKKKRSKKRIKMDGVKKAATMTLISLSRIRVVHGVLHHLSTYGVHLLIQFKQAMIRTTLHLVEAAINGATEMELQEEPGKEREVRQEVELVLNVAKKVICLANVQQEEIMLGVAVAEHVSNAVKKVTCQENAQLVEALPEAVEAEPVSNAEKKAI